MLDPTAVLGRCAVASKSHKHMRMVRQQLYRWMLKWAQQNVYAPDKCSHILVWAIISIFLYSWNIYIYLGMPPKKHILDLAIQILYYTMCFRFWKTKMHQHIIARRRVWAFVYWNVVGPKSQKQTYTWCLWWISQNNANIPCHVCVRFPLKSFLAARCFSFRKWMLLHASGFSSLSPEAKNISSKAQYRAKQVFSIVLAWHLEAILLSWPIKDSSA